MQSIKLPFKVTRLQVVEIFLNQLLNSTLYGELDNKYNKLLYNDSVGLTNTL